MRESSEALALAFGFLVTPTPAPLFLDGATRLAKSIRLCRYLFVKLAAGLKPSEGATLQQWRVISVGTLKPMRDVSRVILATLSYLDVK